ncbi:hypothetical protein [Aureimonas glaciei]|jgi:sulfur relay (sulfurtransferase) complex TusBCD TusD component (DsrE family)|uniref:Flagellar FliJ protein n=1 Tax=Aureimonas glaciei TaxID=1776957 RepID=A0A917DCW3_9HYPH|nr:hypothetical protein [Aureimonas glaciei]GGD27645.1 hypothetical protein GCM10011335_33440 [Aureimonas glaciei]
MSGEGTRAARLERLQSVQLRKRQVEEWRLAELKREGIALAALSVEILQSLGDQSLLQGLFLEAKATTLRRNEVKIVANRSIQVQAELRLREAQGIEKRLERACEEARGVADQIDERTELDLALQDYLTAANASFE